MSIFSFIFTQIIKFYVGNGLVYVYFNFIKREKVTWKQITEEKDNYGMLKYGVMAWALSIIFLIAFVLALKKITTGDL